MSFTYAMLTGSNCSHAYVPVRDSTNDSLAIRCSLWLRWVQLINDVYMYCIRRFQLHIAGDVMLVFHHCILNMLTHISRWWLISVVIHSHCTELVFKETVFLPPIVQYPHAKTIYNIKVWVQNENDALNEGVYQISFLSGCVYFWNGRKDSSFRDMIMDLTNDIWTCNHSIQCKSLFHIRSSCRKHWLIACEVPFALHFWMWFRRGKNKFYAADMIYCE